ncbi:MAG: hypothetical protein LBK59_02480 [Bifidobacteriaceae bacterium]|nr:hypothetical protein [Bifidobacteriaceae bacterium]
MTEPVAIRDLTSSLVVRGTVVESDTVVVKVQSERLRGIVTRLPVEAGESVASGGVVAGVAGRPLFVLPGTVPAYRDIVPGDEGVDVRQVQKALVDLGHLDGEGETGSFDVSTQRSVREFYRSAGYKAWTTEDLLAETGSFIEAAEATVTSAERKLVSDRATLSAMIEARVESKLEGEATAGAPESDSTPGSGATASAADIAQMRQQVRYSKADLAEAEAALAAVQSAAGVCLPLAEIVFVAKLPAIVREVTSAVGDDIVAAGGQVATLITGVPRIQAVVPQGSQGGLRAGLRVRVDDDVNAREAGGTVGEVGVFRPAGSSLGESAEDVVQQLSGYPLVVDTDAPLDVSWSGLDVRVTVTLGSTDGPVLVVPLIAVHDGADGVQSVTVSADEGSMREVAVHVGMVVDGTAEVAPEVPGTLDVGDKVMVG